MGFISNDSKSQKVMRKWMTFLLISVLAAESVVTYSPVSQAAGGYALVVLSKYHCQLKIGQSFYLVGVASNGKRVTWKSSKGSIASVNTYGQVTAKKAGTCKITGKVSGGEASCHIVVEKTKVTLSKTTISMENGASERISGTTSNGSAIAWKSQKTSVATVDEKGVITAVKPGETYIAGKADGTTSKCKVTVKKPTISLSKTSLSMYRKQTYQLSAKTSSGRTVTFKSKKSSVATVTERGRITAVKHGTAKISVSLDGVTKECEVTVKSPDIKVKPDSVTIKKGKTVTLTATVSSGNAPAWKSSKTSVATVNQSGKVTALKKGSCLIYASEDGAKESCHVKVTA